MGPEPAQELHAQGKGVGGNRGDDVVIRAGPERRDLVAHGRACGDHHHEYVMRGGRVLQPRDEVHTEEVREIELSDDEIGAPKADGLQGRPSRLSERHYGGRGKGASQLLGPPDIWIHK